MTALLDIRIADAAPRLLGSVRRTPLEAWRPPASSECWLDARIELRLKLECLQETGSFKARGAWNQISQLTDRERAAGVIATSSGNHGKALAWAAQLAGVRATIVMPKNAYPNKIAACREFGAEVVLGETREAAEALCAERVAAGALLIHPYDAERTIQGAGTVGLEIAEDWPAVDVCVLPVGGGGLCAGSSLALRQVLGSHPRVFAVEPAGAPTMSRALAAGEPVPFAADTLIQGLCPPAVGRRNLEICAHTLDGCHLVADEAILAAQQLLVRSTGHVIEPAGAATTAFVLSSAFLATVADLLSARSPGNPLNVAAVVSGGNPDPAQLAAIR